MMLVRVEGTVQAVITPAARSRVEGPVRSVVTPVARSRVEDQYDLSPLLLRNARPGLREQV